MSAVITIVAAAGANGQELHMPALGYGAVAPPLILAGASLLLLLLSSLMAEKAPVWLYTLYTVAVGTLSIAVTPLLWKDVGDVGAHSTFAAAVASDRFSIYFYVVIGSALILGALLVNDWLVRVGRSGCELFVLMMLAASGAELMAAANDLIVVFLGLEILSIALYVLTGYNREPRSREAAMKYFILGSFSSAIFLYGIALTYGATGTTNISGIADFLSANYLQQRGLLLGGAALLFVGFAFKVAAVPFQQWAPDVYHGAPSSITAFMAAAAKVAAFAAMVRVFIQAFITLQLDWQPFILVIAVITLLVGSIVACVQQNVKRMLAYSSISHAGYILLGLQSANADGVGGALYYLLAYAFMVIGSFAVVAVVGGQSDAKRGIEAFRGLGHTNPVIGLAFTALLFAQAGIPLTSGFLAKFTVISALVENGSYITAVFAMLVAAIAAFFYIRLVIVMFGSTDEKPEAYGIEASGDAITARPTIVMMPATRLVLLITVVLTVGLGIAPPQVLNAVDFARTATAGLF